MMATPAPSPPWREQEARLGVGFLVFLAALAAGALGRPGVLLEILPGGILGYVLAALLVYVWGERTRPRASGPWVLVVLLWLAGVGIFSFGTGIGLRPFLLTFVLTLGTSLLARHEDGLGPSFLLGGAVWGALFLSDALFATQAGERLADSDGVWIATAALLGITAATLEHERLARRDGTPTPAPWTVLRLAFVGVWTIVILSLREEVQWGRLFVVFGADLSGQAGQFLLIGVIVAALALAAYAFKPAKKRGAG